MEDPILSTPNPWPKRDVASIFGIAHSMLTTVAIGSLKLSKLLIHPLPNSLKLSPTVLSKFKFSSWKCSSARFEYQTSWKRLVTIHCEQKGWGSSGALPDPLGALHLRYSPSVHNIVESRYWAPSQKEHAMFCKNCLGEKKLKAPRKVTKMEMQQSKNPAKEDCGWKKWKNYGINKSPILF